MQARKDAHDLAAVALEHCLEALRLRVEALHLRVLVLFDVLLRDGADLFPAHVLEAAVLIFNFARGAFENEVRELAEKRAAELAARRLAEREAVLEEVVIAAGRIRVRARRGKVDDIAVKALDGLLAEVIERPVGLIHHAHRRVLQRVDGGKRQRDVLVLVLAGNTAKQTTGHFRAEEVCIIDAVLAASALKVDVIGRREHILDAE